MIIKKHRYRFSGWAVFLVLLVTAWYGRNLEPWKGNRIIDHDVVSYYAYLPAAFVYDDITFGFTDGLPEDFEGRIWVHETPVGKRTVKMSMGMSLLWSPFFAGAHLWAGAGPAVADGYSTPYQAAIFLAALFYLALGLILLRRLMLRYFGDGPVALVLILLVTATNLMYYVITEPGMTHVYSFCLFALFLLSADNWLTRHKASDAAILGIALGLISLLRPVNAIVVVLLPFWKLRALREIPERGRFFLARWKHLVLIVSGVVTLWTPQLLYWKTITGEWFYYSYGDEGFFFLQPHILEGLLSWRKGWFVYTPLMLLVIPGFYYLLRRKHTGQGTGLLLYLILHVYLTYSWWCWWYGGSFGSRPMIEAYAFLAFPLASLLEAVGRGRWWHKWLMAALLAFFLLLNQVQMKQYRITLLHWDSMSRSAYKALFMKKHWPENYEELLEPPDYERAKRGLPE